MILIFGTKNLIVSEVMNAPCRFGWDAYSFVLSKERKGAQLIGEENAANTKDRNVSSEPSNC